MFKQKLHRKTCLAILLLFLVGWTVKTLQPPYSSTPALDLWMLDVGQGESVFLREPTGKKVLFDGGPDESVLAELGSILPVWDHTIDLVILSHNHSDHLRGIIAVLERYKVKELWTSGALYNSAEYRVFLTDLTKIGIHPKVVFFDHTLCPTPSLSTNCPSVTLLGDLSLQVYRPLNNMQGEIPHDAHDATVIVKVSYGQESVFLTGDLNEGHEQALLQTCHPPSCSLHATILQVPHHGSNTGLATFFLKAVNPTTSLIPVGLGNKFGHPGAFTLQKLQAAHIPIFRTDTQGRIHLTIFKNYYIAANKKPG